MRPFEPNKKAPRLTGVGEAESPAEQVEVGRGTASAVIVPLLKSVSARRSAGTGEAVLGERTPEARLEEAAGLAQAIELDVRQQGAVSLTSPRPSTLLGAGKVEELKGQFAADDIELVVVDHPLSPVQQRNLERAWGLKVLDRTALILEIFGRRARTREGRLQVELAHLTYQKSRLVRSWTHLERQRGGVGFMGGPGETQIEADRRMIQDRINAIRRDLEGVKRTRELHRRGRRRVPYPVVALVGYTNAGKSTLFNRLTGDGVLARDQLFATLDPTMREVVLESGRRVIVSDTVGFISDLPTGLIAAFRATLEEVVEADLIVHVRNIAHPDSDAQARDVESVLGELGVVTGAGGTAVIEVWNKSDLLDAERRQVLAHTAGRRDDPPRLVSAVTGEGVGDLLAGIDEALAGQDTWMRLAIEPAGGALLSWLHENAQVLERDTDTEGVTHVDIRIDAAHRDRLLGRLSRGDAAGHARVEEAGG